MRSVPILKQLHHWFPVNFRIHFKYAQLLFELFELKFNQPTYLADFIVRSTNSIRFAVLLLDRVKCPTL